MRRVAAAEGLKFQLGLNDSQVASSAGIARSTVQDYLGRMAATGLDQDQLIALSDEAACPAASGGACPASRSAWTVTCPPFTGAATPAFALEDMYDLADPVDAAPDILGLAVPDPPAQALDLLDDHGLGVQPAAPVGARTQFLRLGRDSKERIDLAFGRGLRNRARRDP